MNLKKELTDSWSKAQKLGGVLELKKPGDLDPATAASITIGLLQKVYKNHAISKSPDQLESDIQSHKVMPWIVTRDNNPVACAALVCQSDGSLELGRAVSIENGSGVGKVVMLSAASSCDPHRLVAEVRLADNFRGIPGSEATQRICLDLLGLSIHALLPAFNHDNRNELFGFAAARITRNNHHQPILTAHQTFVNRNMHGSRRKLQLVQSIPFRVFTVGDSGQDIDLASSESRANGAGCSLVPIEVVDQNLATIKALLDHDFIVAGLDRTLSAEQKPILWLATVAREMVLAPTQPSSVLPRMLQHEIAVTANQFQRLAIGDRL